jgi:hypothetical protein
MSICVVVVHRPLAHLVCSGPIGPGPELGGCPPLAQGIPCFDILNQPIDFNQKVLLLLQEKVFRYFGINWLLQLVHVVGN